MTRLNELYKRKNVWLQILNNNLSNDEENIIRELVKIDNQIKQIEAQAKINKKIDLRVRYEEIVVDLVDMNILELLEDMTKLELIEEINIGIKELKAIIKADKDRVRVLNNIYQTTKKEEIERELNMRLRVLDNDNYRVKQLEHTKAYVYHELYKK